MSRKSFIKVFLSVGLWATLMLKGRRILAILSDVPLHDNQRRQFSSNECLSKTYHSLNSNDWKFNLIDWIFNLFRIVHRDKTFSIENQSHTSIERRINLKGVTFHSIFKSLRLNISIELNFTLCFDWNIFTLIEWLFFNLSKFSIFFQSL